MSADWQPLERMLGPSLCVDFMFMGRSEQIHLYKHRDTRRYLNIAPDGPAFATRLTTINGSDSRRRSSRFSIEDR
jgi:hypothetical protein